MLLIIFSKQDEILNVKTLKYSTSDQTYSTAERMFTILAVKPGFNPRHSILFP